MSDNSMECYRHKETVRDFNCSTVCSNIYNDERIEFLTHLMFLTVDTTRRINVNKYGWGLLNSLLFSNL